MIRYILYSLFFIKQIFNYTFSIHLYSCCNWDFFIKLNELPTYSRKYYENINTFNQYNELDPIYVTITSIEPDYRGYREVMCGFIELENNCTLLFTNNSLINVHKYYWETKLLENVNCICYELFNNEQ